MIRLLPERYLEIYEKGEVANTGGVRVRDDSKQSFTMLEKIVAISLVILALYGIFSIGGQTGLYLKKKFQNLNFSLMTRRVMKVPNIKLTNINGEEISLYDVSGGNPIIVSIGSVNCPSCQAEIKEVTSNDDLLKRVEKILWIFCFIDNVDEVRNYFMKQRLNFPIYVISKESANKLFISYIPTVYIIDGNEKLLWYRVGFDENFFTDLVNFVGQNLNLQKKGGD